MSDAFLGILRLFTTSPRAISFCAGIALFGAYLLADLLRVPESYRWAIAVSGGFLLIFWLVLCSIVLYAYIVEIYDSRKARRARITSLTGNELEILATFVIQKREHVTFPREIVGGAFTRLIDRDMLVFVDTGTPMMQFELAGWVREELQRDRSLLRKRDGHEAAHGSDICERGWRGVEDDRY